MFSASDARILNPVRIEVSICMPCLRIEKEGIHVK